MNFRGTPLQNEDYEPLREATATGVQTSELREPAPLTPDEILWKEVEARGLVSGRFDPKSFPKLPARTLSSGDYPLPNSWNYRKICEIVSGKHSGVPRAYSC